jgi:hypothetical protein
MLLSYVILSCLNCVTHNFIILRQCGAPPQTQFYRKSCLLVVIMLLFLPNYRVL